MTIAAFAPPSAMRFAAGGIWISPGIGPTVTPWSIGTSTLLRVFRSMIRSRRIFFRSSGVRLRPGNPRGRFPYLNAPWTLRSSFR